MSTEPSSPLSQLGKIAIQSKPEDPLLQQTINDKTQDRALKKLYGQWFIGILIGQLVVMNLIFIGAGFKWITYDQWQLDLYMTGTLLEVFGIVLVITKNLFPNGEKPSP